MAKHVRSWSQAPEDDNANQGEIWQIMEYYQHVFALFHQELAKSNYKSDIPHPIRQRYWHLLPYRQYTPDEGRPFLFQYLKSVEDEIAAVVGKHSMAYWLHIYRRLAPDAIGADRQPYTIGLTRATLEAAIQKYALFQSCSRVGMTNKVPIDKVFNGLLLHPEFEHERQMLEHSQQLVLTDFSTVELREFYDVERLAYEAWRTAALLRIIGKGADLVVGGDEKSVFDARSSELAKLITIFDLRVAERDNLTVSATGVMFVEDAIGFDKSGMVFLPAYNLGHLTSDYFEKFFAKVFQMKISPPVVFNFIWIPFNLRDFRIAHLPFAEAFERKHGIKLDAVLAVLAALLYRVFYSWVETKGAAIVRYWQRAYEGPYKREYIADEIRAFLPAAFQILGLDNET